MFATGSEKIPSAKTMVKKIPLWNDCIPEPGTTITFSKNTFGTAKSDFWYSLGSLQIAIMHPNENASQH